MAGEMTDLQPISGLDVILASSSPRRRQLLDLVGIHHTVRPADVDETLMPGELPEAYAERLARAKAEAVAVAARDAVVIAADTIVVVDGVVLGKPRDSAEAARMLDVLSGRTHTVMTAVAVSWSGRALTGVEMVDVTFVPVSRDEIDAYIATGEPMDKAGAYGIQGFGATIVRRIEGDYFAVMGLSLVTLVSLLREIGIAYDFPR
jgi:septum formation protein